MYNTNDTIIISNQNCTSKETSTHHGTIISLDLEASIHGIEKNYSR